MTIARLVKDGRFFDPYLPQGIYGDLRVLANTRSNLIRRKNAVKNTITAILDEYFPELWTVFKHPLNGKASRQILRWCPLPDFILKLGEDGVLIEIRKAVKRTVGMKKAQELVRAARNSIGVRNGLDAVKIRLRLLLDELELFETQLNDVEQAMEAAILKTGYSEWMLSIKGIGVVTAASFLGEVGDPLRFQSARQIANYAGYNLSEDSSGKSKSGTCISKRGRKQLRSVLYQMAFTMVGKNAEMKELYQYLIKRKANPLKKKQALVVISKKIITVIYSLLKKQTGYDPECVLGIVRKEIMLAA
jgi:transposase